MIWKYNIYSPGDYGHLRMSDLTGPMNCMSFRLYGGFKPFGGRECRHEIGHHREYNLGIL